MPISPENMSKYPGGSIRSPEWLAIRERILEREGNCCKFCGVANYAEIWNWNVCREITIVLTIAHLDGKLDDHSDENLAALCQKCHNRLDGPARRRNAAKTRRSKLAVGDLFG